MNKLNFAFSEAKVAKSIAALTVLGLFAVGNATGVFAAFWRTLSDGGLVSNITSFEYGYGYGSLGYGYGYGYGYGAPDNGLSGYYYVASTGGAADYTGATVVTAGTISNVSSIVGTPTAATSLTITAPAVFAPSTGVRVTLPAGLVITNATGGTINTTALAASSLGSPTVSLGTDTLRGAIEFGIPNVKINFSKPVKIEIPVSSSAVYILAKVKHATVAGYTTDSLTNNATDTCTNGVAGAPTNYASVVGGIATVYTCSASEFVTYDSNSSSGGSGGGGGGGGAALPSNTTAATVTSVTASGVTISTTPTTTTVVTKTPTGTKTITFNKPSVVITDVKEIKFTDISTNWAKDYIHRLVVRGVINNTEKFNPNNNLTRAEFLKIAYNASGKKVSSTAGIKFADVKSTDWFAPYVALAISENIISTKNANFRPNDTITRGEAAKIIVGIFGVTPSMTKTSFSDVDATLDLAKYIETAKSLGMFAGQTVNGKLTFRPNDAITRAEISKVVVKAFDL